MTVNLSVLERLLAEATERPWAAEQDEQSVILTGQTGFDVPHLAVFCALDDQYVDDARADATLIAEAVNALPALIAAVKALRNAVVLESAADFTDDENADLRQRAEACYAALAAFSFEEQA